MSKIMWLFRFSFIVMFPKRKRVTFKIPVCLWIITRFTFMLQHEDEAAIHPQIVNNYFCITVKLEQNLNFKPFKNNENIYDMLSMQYFKCYFHFIYGTMVVFDCRWLLYGSLWWQILCIIMHWNCSTCLKTWIQLQKGIICPFQDVLSWITESLQVTDSDTFFFEENFLESVHHDGESPVFKENGNIEYDWPRLSQSPTRPDLMYGNAAGQPGHQRTKSAFDTPLMDCVGHAACDLYHTAGFMKLEPVFWCCSLDFVLLNYFPDQCSLKP